MKTLYLLRHAKTDRNEPGLEDFQRPLAPAGRESARRMGLAMRSAGYEPALALCSSARRAMETWEIVSRLLSSPVPVRSMRTLYLAPPGRILDLLRRVPDDLSPVIVIGHNPGLHSLAEDLAGAGSDAAALTFMTANFPTAALAVLHLSIPGWNRISPGAGRLETFIHPRDLA